MHNINYIQILNIKSVSPTNVGISVPPLGEQNASFKKPIVSAKLMFKRLYSLYRSLKTYGKDMVKKIYNIVIYDTKYNHFYCVR